MLDRIKSSCDKADYGRAVKLTSEYLRTHPAITNRELRAISAVSYDDAIRFLGRMVDEGLLTRMGKSSGTRYVLAPRP